MIEIVSILKAAEDEETLSVDYAKKIVFDILNKEYVASKTKPAEASKITFNNFVAEYIRQCETGERLKQKSTQMIAASTVKGYKGFQAQLKAYQKKRHKTIDFDDITLEFYDDFKRFFIEKQYSPNTIARHIRILKIILHAAKDMKLTTKDDFENSHFSADWVDVDNVYLTEEQIDEMYELDLSKRKAWEQARDVFVVGCLTGQRVSDYKRIKMTMIEKLRDGNDYLHIRQQKTDKWIYIPLDERVRKVLEKYDGELPVISDQKINEYIKKVGEQLGWTWNAGIKERRGSIEYTSNKRFCDCIKTHTARRSFATNAYKNNIPLSSIMAITGHSSETMLKKYLKLDEEEKAIMASRDFRALIKKKIL